MALHVPLQTPLEPMDLYYTLMFQDNPQKSPVYTYTQLLNPYSHVYAAFDFKLVYIGMCA